MPRRLRPCQNTSCNSLVSVRVAGCGSSPLNATIGSTRAARTRIGSAVPTESVYSSAPLNLPAVTIVFFRDDIRADFESRDPRGLARSRIVLHVEVMALRHQVQVQQQSHPRRLRLMKADRWLWAWLSTSWPAWRTALVIVKPETVLAWHRQGFRWYWSWKSRRRIGRPAVPRDVRALIRTMSEANPLWGAPRIHGELLKLGFDVSQASVAKYMVRRAQTTIADLAHVPHESPPANRRGRLLRRADRHMPARCSSW